MIETIFSLPLYVTMPVVLVVYSGTCLGAGLLFLKWLESRVNQIERISAGTLLATGFILGQGVIASTWLLLALGGWFSIHVVGILCIFFAVGGLYIGSSLFSRLKKQIASVWNELGQETWGWQFLIVMTLILCLLWITSLARPLTGDGASFYFPLGKVVAESHRLVPLPGYERFTNVGLQGEMHFAALMTLHSPESAKLFAWPTILAGGVILLALCREVGLGRRGQWIALMMLFTSSAVIRLSGDGKVDLFAVPFGLGAYYWIFQTYGNSERLAAWLTGFFAGFAIVAKFSYLAVIAPGILLLLFWGFRENHLGHNQYKRILIRIFVISVQILAGLLIAIAPHLIKNTLLYQNPIAPFGTNDIGWAKQVWFSQETTHRILLTYPIALTYGNYWAQYGTLSPLILAFFPIALFLPKPRYLLGSPLAAITISALIGVLTWVITQSSVLAPRYILATLSLFFLLPARAAEYISQTELRPRLLTFGIMVCMGVTIISVGLRYIGIVFFPGDTLSYLRGPSEECARDGEYCQAMAVINREARQGHRVFLASYQRYWLRGDLLQCVQNKDDMTVINAVTADRRWAKIYQRGFRFLLADPTTHSTFLDSLNLENPPSWLELTPLYEGEQLKVYRLVFHQPPTSRLVSCRPSQPLAWDVVEN